MPTFPQISDPTPNVLFDPIGVQKHVANIQTNTLLQEQTRQALTAQDYEMVARGAQSLLALGDEKAMADAYPGMIADMQRDGWARHATATFPGKAQLERLALMGTPSQELSKQAANRQGNAALLAGQGGGGAPGATTTPVATTPGFPSGGGVAFRAKNLPQGITPEEDQYVRTVYGEARGEPVAGQQAVAHVIRTRAGKGGGAEAVIFAPNQFEPWNNGATRAKLEALDPNSAEYQAILNNAVRPVLSGQAEDPTRGATHFYSPGAQKALGREPPSWATGEPVVIGGHNFYNPGATPSGGGGGGRVQVASTTPTQMQDGTTTPPVPGVQPPAPQQQTAAATPAVAQAPTFDLPAPGQRFTQSQWARLNALKATSTPQVLAEQMNKFDDDNRVAANYANTERARLEQQRYARGRDAEADRIAAEKRVKDEEDRQRNIEKDRETALRQGRTDEAAAKAAEALASRTRFEQSNALRDEVNKLSETFRPMQEAKERIDAAAAAGNALGDLGLIYTYTRLLDPATVHEEEIKRGMKAGGLGEYVSGWFDRVARGESLTPAVRQQFAEMASRFYDVRKKAYDQELGKYRDLAVRFGLDPDTVAISMARDQPPPPSKRPPLATFDSP